MRGSMVAALIFLAIANVALASEKGEICISRGEDNGVLNIRAAQITANGKHLLWITGGETKCIEVKPGQYQIVAQSSDPYDPDDKNQATWKSKALKITLQAGGKATMSLSPVSRGAAYVGPWELKQ